VIGSTEKLYSYVTEDTLRFHYKTLTARAVLRTNRCFSRQPRHYLEASAQLHALAALPHGKHRVPIE
jgi:hypothetical protein